MILSNQWITPLVVRAGRAFIAAKGKDPAVEGAALAEWLRSGAEIGPAEREMLADLVTGEWRDRKGAKPRKSPGHSRAKEIVADLNSRLQKYGPKMGEAARQDTANAFGISVRTLSRYMKEAKELEQAIKRVTPSAK
ncbi:MAG: hypothetical protein IKG52_09765 [Rhodobacteraceae bacterium]|nr:hypothetical protein [Paracoccaceae bacterium]